MTWWHDFWTWADTSPLGATIVGGLVVAAIVTATGLVVSTFRRSWRVRVWGGIATLTKWLWSHRLKLTTEFHYQEAIRNARVHSTKGTKASRKTEPRAAARGAEREPPGASAKASLATAEHEARPTDASVVESAPAEPRLRPWPSATTVESASVESGLRPWPDEGAKPRRPQLPLPEPRWTIYASPKKDDDFNKFTIRNAVPRSVAREVRVDGDEDFKVTDAGHWADLSGHASGEFRGNMTLNGQQNGVRFQIVWYDENDVKRSGFYDLPGRGSLF